MMDPKISVECNYTQVRKAEEAFLRKLNFQIPKDLQILDVPFIFRGRWEYMHTFHLGNPKAENLVMLHGLGASGLCFFNLFRALEKKYNIWSFDFLGQGASSRPPHEASNDPKEVINFFVESIECWRKAAKIEKASLLGHSFGGYFASIYAIRYPQHVNKLILISPAGFSKTISLPERLRIERKRGLAYGMLDRVSFFLFKQKLNLSELFKKYPNAMEQAMKFYLQQKLNFQDTELFELFLKYCLAYFFLPAGSQSALPCLLSSHRGDAYLPIEDMLEEKPLDIPFDFYYGEKDPLNYKGVERLVQKKKLKGAIFFVEEAGHQIIFENPQMICRLMLARKDGAYQGVYGVVREKRSKIFTPELEPTPHWLRNGKLRPLL